MKQNKLSFESENLVVDYISFKFQDLKDLKEKKNLSITQIAKVTGRGRNTIYKVLIPYNRLVKNVNQEAVHETK